MAMDRSLSPRSVIPRYLPDTGAICMAQVLQRLTFLPGVLRLAGGNRLEGRAARAAPLGFTARHGKRANVEFNHERQPGRILYPAHRYCLAAARLSLEVGLIPGSGSCKQANCVVLRSVLFHHDVASI